MCWVRELWDAIVPPVPLFYLAIVQRTPVLYDYRAPSCEPQLREHGPDLSLEDPHGVFHLV